MEFPMLQEHSRLEWSSPAAQVEGGLGGGCLLSGVREGAWHSLQQAHAIVTTTTTTITIMIIIIPINNPMPPPG